MSTEPTWRQLRPALDEVPMHTDARVPADRWMFIPPHQQTPHPHPLERIAPGLTYPRANWSFRFDPGTTYGAALHIYVMVPDNDRPGQLFQGIHGFPVPPVGEQSDEWWLRWVLECCFMVEQHEAREALRYHGMQIFRPAHFREPDKDGSIDPHRVPPWPGPNLTGWRG